jgi:hypothetical protein
MKNMSVFFTAIILMVSALKVSAQNGFSGLIKSGPGDATRLFDAYADPLFKGFGVGMNSGWNNSAKTKDKLRFDVRITASAAFVPSGDKSFDVTQIGLSNNVRLKAGSPALTPTIGGGNNPTTLEIFDDNNQKVDEFQLPNGKTSVIPTPQIQVTVGIINNTDLTLRGIPKINLGEDLGSVSMLGFGLKHNIMADFGTAGKLAPFDLALAFGYNRLNTTVPLDVKPDAGAVPAPGNTNSSFNDQHIEGHFNSFQVQAIISKDFSSFTPFFALGYNTTKTNVNVLGNYPITNSSLAGQDFYETFTNPISINKKSINGIRADIGFQLKVSFFRVFGSYSIAQYQSVNAGIGFGI